MINAQKALRLYLAIVCLGASGYSGADIYKCVDGSGHATYDNKPGLGCTRIVASPRSPSSASHDSNAGRNKASAKPQKETVDSNLGEVFDKSGDVSQRFSNEIKLWSVVSEEDSIASYKRYVATYPNGVWAGLARQRIKERVASEAQQNVIERAGQASQSSSGRRVALVIGNGEYLHAELLPKLVNPLNDASDMAVALRGFGFDVYEKHDLTFEEMQNAIAEFGRRAIGSEAALFYYAGHGIQAKGVNYLLPVDAKVESEARIQYASVSVNQILEELDNAKVQANIVILDACRNNPISGKFRSGGTRGLAPVTASPKGTVIVYATDPGNVAEDGKGRNGLFTGALLKALRGDNLTLSAVLVSASEDVERMSGQSQTPYINGPATLQHKFVFSRTKDRANSPASAADISKQ